MDSTSRIFLISGIITVLLGIFLIFKSREKTTSELEEILISISSLENKVELALKKIEEINTSIKEIKFSSNEKLPTHLINEQMSSKNKIFLKHKEVYTLYQQGLSAKDIAMKLNRGLGEIETIIGLFNFEGDYNG
ncbi:hypothetical protein SAMN02745227_00112 [Anaerobranca californiensis DSM 14826]|jgi:DNA-binding NarL/FixJ family response regulator|uniref:DUF2802 domain-containing protein n=1 Tax=Anaerobranca californiensis DSM 14826 TaxID=1120989 RepID=A0A1M6KGH2_9FIRM|nr:hypothetical protein [Anaerobranca californiensis]SHJ58045.1 hypothetical protein SAMN02745227_00112 [Anaerobranca californiensis DSM 14826]